MPFKNIYKWQKKKKWKCKNGHIWEAVPSSVKQGHWCSECAGNKRLSIDDMKKLALKRKGKCISDLYLGSDKNLLWECENKHRWKAAPTNVKKGTWCKICSRKNAGLKRRLTIEEMQKIAKGKKGKCISKQYINSLTNLTWKCKKGHFWDATPSNIKRGTWCPYCSGNRKEK